MKKGLFVWCFFLLSVKVFGQQFSQYNTNTLYDSFENPAQRSFIPDTTKNIAFNFFIPNFTANLYVTGNAQEALKSRLFSSYYNTADLKVGQGKFNHLNLNANLYSVMVKLFLSENGDQEAGFFINTKTELRGLATDETLALFNGYANFPNNNYPNVFNDNYFLQVYHQIGFTYREQVTKKFAFGIKLSALSGLSYSKFSIDKSNITFDKPNDRATLSLQGTDTENDYPAGYANVKKILPTFLNPGAAISIGTSYIDENGYKWQGNIKDLGFIHWNSRSQTNTFSADTLIRGLSTPDRESNIIDGATNLSAATQKYKGFTSPTNGLLEVSVNRSYWLGNEQQFKFSPTLIASKELFYAGFTAALVAPLQYSAYTLSLTPSYNELRLLNIGAQFMVKGTNSEFFIGSERLYQTAHFISNAIHTSSIPGQPQFTTVPGSYTGMDFFIGASFKFGQLIERQLNSSSVPNGDKGFLGKLWEKWFHKDKNY